MDIFQHQKSNKTNINGVMTVELIVTYNGFYIKVNFHKKGYKEAKKLATIFNIFGMKKVLDF